MANIQPIANGETGLSARNKINEAIVEANKVEAATTIATNRIKGRVTADTGAVEDLTASQVKTLLDLPNDTEAVITSINEVISEQQTNIDTLFSSVEIAETAITTLEEVTTLVTEAAAQEGTETAVKGWSALRVWDAIRAWWVSLFDDVTVGHILVKGASNTVTGSTIQTLTNNQPLKSKAVFVDDGGGGPLVFNFEQAENANEIGFEICRNQMIILTSNGAWPCNLTNGFAAELIQYDAFLIYFDRTNANSVTFTLTGDQIWHDLATGTTVKLDADNNSVLLIYLGANKWMIQGGEIIAP